MLTVPLSHLSRFFFSDRFVYPLSHDSHFVTDRDGMVMIVPSSPAHPINTIGRHQLQRDDREGNDKQLFAENRGKSRVGGQKVAIG